jgi:hypothetical protein
MPQEGLRYLIRAHSRLFVANFIVSKVVYPWWPYIGNRTFRARYGHYSQIRFVFFFEVSEEYCWHDGC